LVADLEKHFGSELSSTLEPGENGVFDVKIDGTLVYSKFRTGRFPDPREIIAAIEQK
jgi:selT/selW/selH-like putative selenoprotein